MKSNKTRFSLFGRNKFAASAVALLSLFMASQSAAISITSVVDDNLDGTYTYNYTVDNSNGTFDIASWVLEFDFNSSEADFSYDDVPFGGDVTVPDGWGSMETLALVGKSAIEFFGLDFGGADDILMGEILSDFSFTTAFVPGDIVYSVYSFGYSNEVSGTVTGPTPPSSNPVPDAGSTTALFGMGLMGLVLLRFSSKRRKNG